MYALSNKK